MEATATERRLAAILAADVVGYSRLIENDEASTLAAIRKLRAEVIDPLLAKHHGRIVKLMGDGAIVEFGSVVDAVSCAVALQKDVAAAQAEIPVERRIVFRIGINLGDVVVEGDDLLGDGVNVAARLEQLCDPGGVLLSGSAHDQLQGKIGLPLDYTGDQRVKNIARPVRTYRVRFEGSGRPLGAGEAHRQGPNLHGIYGREAGSLADFKYSKALAAGGWTWTEDDARPVAENAQAAHPGTVMSHRQHDPAKRTLIIELLKSLADEG